MRKEYTNGSWELSRAVHLSLQCLHPPLHILHRHAIKLSIVKLFLQQYPHIAGRWDSRSRDIGSDALDRLDERAHLLLYPSNDGGLPLEVRIYGSDGTDKDFSFNLPGGFAWIDICILLRRLVNMVLIMVVNREKGDRCCHAEVGKFLEEPTTWALSITSPDFSKSKSFQAQDASPGAGSVSDPDWVSVMFQTLLMPAHAWTRSGTTIRRRKVLDRQTQTTRTASQSFFLQVLPLSNIKSKDYIPEYNWSERHDNVFATQSSQPPSRATPLATNIQDTGRMVSLKPWMILH